MILRKPIKSYVYVSQTFNPPTHYGVDFSAYVGTEVYAACDGTAYLGNQGTLGFGKYVRIETVEDTSYYVYTAHLDDWRVSEGQPVRAGDLIGLSGNTGNSSGPHLHFEVRRGSRLQASAIDPWPMIVWEDAPVPNSKLGLQFQTPPSWHASVVNGTGIPWVKLINPSGAYPYSRPVNVIGRLWIGGDAIEQDYVNAGASGAERYYALLRDRYAAAPWVTVWEGPNEPRPYWDGLVNLNAFTIRWAELMHAAGYKVAVGCLSVGRPDEGIAHAIGPCLQTADYLALHEYAQPRMQTDATWLCLRYRRTVAELESAGYHVPPILITECGIDGGAVTPEREDEKRPGIGWVGFCSESEYREQLAWYDSEICKDSIVVAATPFVAGPNSDWLTFDISESTARWIGSRYATEPAQPVDMGAYIAEQMQAYVIPLVDYAALERKGRELGLVAVSVEKTITVDGQDYVAQVYRSPVLRDVQYHLWCRMGDWGNITVTERAN